MSIVYLIKQDNFPEDSMLKFLTVFEVRRVGPVGETEPSIVNCGEF